MPEKTATGFYWPTGTSQIGDSAGWLSDGCSWSGNYSYYENEYHIGKDIAADVGDPVYAIADGQVLYKSLNGWGLNNVALLIVHSLSDGSSFTAVYGHIRSELEPGDRVEAGQPFAKVGPWTDDSHLHFGVRPGTSIEAPYGRMPCPPEGPIIDRNDSVDPIEWITTRSPGKEITARVTPTPLQTPTPPAPVPTPPDGDGPGVILHKLIVDGGGAYETRLVARDINGQELAQIPLPSRPWIHDLIPARASNRALASTVDNGWLLVDVASGVAEELEVPIRDERGLELWTFHSFRSSGAEHHIILNSSWGAPVYLINPETGGVKNIIDIDDSIVRTLIARFSPDEKHLAFHTGADVWLMNAEKPYEARRLGNGDSVLSFGFSSDGAMVAYIQYTDSGRFEIAAENVDRSGAQVVATDHGWVGSLAYVPGQRQLVLEREDGVSLLSLNDGQEQELMEIPSRYFMWLAPGGRFLLVGAPDERGWHLVDLEENSHRRLDQVDGYEADFRSPYHRWLYFRDNTKAAAAINIAALDLDTGVVQPMRGLSSTTIFRPVEDLSDDAGRVLIWGHTDGGDYEYWLLVAEEGRAQLLAKGPGLQGDLSADGQWFVYSQWHEDRQNGELIWLEVDSGERRSVGEGVSPIWVRP